MAVEQTALAMIGLSPPPISEITENAMAGCKSARKITAPSAPPNVRKGRGRSENNARGIKFYTPPGIRLSFKMR
jgi:hypothetical protein